MKKHNLFKILGIVIVAYCILTWIIPASYYSNGLQSLGKYQVGIFDLFNITFQTFGYFSSTFLFILVVGAFYKVLDATGLYRKTLDFLSKKMKKHKLLWLIVITVVIAILSSLVGLELGMFIIFPFIISLVMLLGYDKLTALLSTLGATIVGMIGSTYSYTMYGINNNILGLTFKEGIIIKLVLLVLSLGLLILFMVLRNKPNKKSKKKDKEKDEKSLDKFIPQEKEARKVGCKKIWPIMLIFALCFVVLLLGSFNLASAFGLTWFNDIHTKIMEVKIGEFTIFEKLLGGIEALGTWAGPTRFVLYSGIILLATILLVIIYRIKFNDYLKAMLDGAKEYFGTALLVTFAYVILVIASSFPVFLTIVDFVTKGKFNIATLGLMNMIGGAVYVDMYYYPQYVLQYFGSFENVDTTILNVLVVSLYSVVMLVAPTSTLMLATLSKTETKYIDWLKFVWKLFLSLTVVIFIVLTIFFVI